MGRCGAGSERRTPGPSEVRLPPRGPESGRITTAGFASGGVDWAGFVAVDEGFFGAITGGLPTTAGRTGLAGRTSAAPPAAGRSGGFAALPAINSLSRATSSSVMLASAEPLSWIPAREQISTSSLLSSFNSFARV